MKTPIILILATLFLNLNLNGQTRTIVGRVISEDLEPLPMLDIENSDNILLGKTDMNGRFKISIPQETDSLLFRYIGMEWTDIKLTNICDTVEIIMMHYVRHHARSSRKIDRHRKKRFDNLSNLHADAVKKGLFNHDQICYLRAFEEYKPSLDKINKELKEKIRANKHDFKNLNIGDTVKIPFGLESSEKKINTYYTPCLICTEEDYNYVIEGEIINKHRSKLTIEVKVTKMKPYASLEYRGKTLNVGTDFKYKMKYFEVIIEK
ncbi:hypothetical protein [Aureibacter tunicatorum]|uniref:Carboxypeptidase-like protein n=1 Tax=Aureibacter tunicatorum TaxID=866807 RepID=A0AAE3XQV2_9BACT|nr:hypothetical protein [Aureibacter tunicatorum]MDR6241083.1 hypothetical protein [Aureibacter tunicatorum]BDD03861.1 hypothetical protein AUTU_13440 [Aureibacter tunicatorum]